jgi:hypothetical protein
MPAKKAKPPPDPERQESYERFKALAEKLLAVPKSEVDKEAEAFKRRPKGGRGRPPKDK